MDNTNIDINFNNTRLKNSLVRFSILLLLGCSFYVTAASDEKIEIDEIEIMNNIDAQPKTAIEVIINKRISESILDDNRPDHVYRPRTPIFHKYHPENVPNPPVIKKYLLVDHPEINNNQGRNIRQKNKESK